MYFPESFNGKSLQGRGRFLDVDMRRNNNIENSLILPVQRWYQGLEHLNQVKVSETVENQRENVKIHPGANTTTEIVVSERQSAEKPNHIEANFSDHFIVRRKQVEVPISTRTPPLPAQSPNESEINLILSSNPRNGTSASGPVYHDEKKGLESFGGRIASTKSILTPFHHLRPNRNSLKPATDRACKQGLSCAGIDTRYISEAYARHGGSAVGKTTASLSYLRPLSSGFVPEVFSGKINTSAPVAGKTEKFPSYFQSSASPLRIVEENVSATLENYKLISPQNSTVLVRTTGLEGNVRNEKPGHKLSLLDASLESMGTARNELCKEEVNESKVSPVSEKGDVASKTTFSISSATDKSESGICRSDQSKLRPWTESTASKLSETGGSSLRFMGGPSHSFSHSQCHAPMLLPRSVQLRYGKSDLSSPLGNFHQPIRNYLMSSINSDNYGYFTTVEHQLPSIFWTCSQIYPIPIQLVMDYLVSVKKVGEGVYGEVYKGYFRGVPDPRVYKIIPIEGDKLVNAEKQKKFGEIEPEIIIAQELNKLRFGMIGCFTDGHCRLLNGRICKGRYPSVLTEQWKSWHKTYVSQNDLPDFGNNQLYVILEFEFHGTDIETYKFRNAKQSMAVLIHVIYALAAAEAGLEFEHRDLHWGNILVVKTREMYTTYSIDGIKHRVPNCGLKSTIIDYTISRLTSTETGNPVYTDLSKDNEQFCGSEDYQFEIYRMMRTENKNEWSTFCPKTNIFWMHYLVGKLIEKARYGDATSGTHYHFKNKLLRIQSNILKYNSCLECVHKFIGPYTRDLEPE